LNARRIRRVVASGTLVGLAISWLSACAISNTVRVEPKATADSVVFSVTGVDGPSSPTSLIYGMSVVTCGDERIAWMIASDGSRTLPRQVRYGQAIPGFEAKHAAEPLVAGCYKVFVSGSKPVTIDVLRDRSVVVRP